MTAQHDQQEPATAAAQALWRLRLKIAGFLLQVDDAVAGRLSAEHGAECPVHGPAMRRPPARRWPWAPVAAHLGLPRGRLAGPPGRTRRDGRGHRTAGAALAMTALVLAGGSRLSPLIWGFPVAVLAGLLAAWALRRRAVRRLGGITGDVLGALVEIATAAALVTCAVAVG
ncbi:adenosylcobinamide-GDP ribazoletransferase [Sphaerisporangium flaviroseum]